MQDFSFVAFSSLGAMAREYEVAQLSQILQMVGPESPAHGAILVAIIDHLNVGNRDEIMQVLQQAQQPDPAAQQAAQQQQQMQAAITQGQVQLLNAQAAESQSRAQKYNTEAQLMPTELSLKYTEDDEEKEFQRRATMGRLLLDEQKLQGQQDKDMEQTKAKAEAELIRQLTEGANGQPNTAGPSEAPSGPSL